MAPLETVFFWTAVVLFALSTVLSLYGTLFKKAGAIDASFYISLLAFGVLNLAIFFRLEATGNLPVAGPYESSLGGVWFIMVFYVGASLKFKSLRITGIALFPLSLLLLGYGVMSNPLLAPMTAALRSIWLYIHVLFAWLAFGAFSICLGLGVLYLLKDKAPQRELLRKIPEPERIEELAFKYLIFGFVTDAVMIASGAMWAKNLWGHYWNWDPVETWSLITWLIYGLIIHLRLTMGWKGRRFAWLLILAFPGMVITYFGIDLLVKSSLHIFEAWQEI